MRFIDLFSGIGGFRLGMESVGHECIGFCEIDKFARESYKSIFQTEGEIEFHDIRDVSDDEFKKLRELFRESNQELWTSCEFDFNNEGKLNVSFDYIDWKNSGFGQISRDYYYEYKKFGIIPELDYAKKEIKDIEKFIKEQEKE